MNNKIKNVLDLIDTDESELYIISSDNSLNGYIGTFNNINDLGQYIQLYIWNDVAGYNIMLELDVEEVTEVKKINNNTYYIYQNGLIFQIKI